MSSRQILLGRYKILSLLGKGSSGQVFKVEDRLAPGCILAAKAFSPPVSPARLEQIRAEFRALTSLAHPNILRAHDLHAVPGLEPYVLTSEMVEGRPLLDVALDLPWRRALGLFRPICSALQHLHTRGMVHRDISSSNILVEQTTALLRPVLMDLGLTARHGLRLGSRRAGTIHYIPPEVLDDQPAGKEGDLYAVGILLYRILAGRFPFTGGTLPQLEEAIRRSDPPPLAEQAPALPFSLCTAVERLLNREPARRFPDAASLWQAIQPYSDLNASDIHLPLPPPASWPLAGRQREMARITATLDRPALLSGRRPARQVQVILLSGPQGSGKSRLLAETKRYGQLQGLPSVLVSCRSLLPRPLGLISWVVQALLQLVGSRLEGQKPLGTILETHKEIMRHLARVDTGNEPSHEQDREAFCLEEEIPPLLRQLSEVQPFVLAVDDLEAADTPSAHCLERLLMKVPGAFVLVLAGHTERIQALADLEPQADRPTLLMVPPLRPGEIASFLSEFSPRFRAPETMAAELHRVSCGRPAFLTALLQRLFETIPGSEQMPTAALQEMELPSCISSWAVTQLSALTPLEMALLQILAAAQEGMAPQDLHDLLPSPHTEPALKEALESLMERGLAARQEDCRRAELSATHPLVRRLVVEQMEKAHLQRVHGKLADVILARPAEIEAGQTDHLAFHLLKAGRMTEAARWAVTAGRTALAHGSLEKAASLFRTALTHLGPGDQVLRRETLQSLGRILADLGQFPDATHLLEQLVREAGEARDSRYVALGLSGLARVQLRRFQYEAAEELSRRALKIARQTGDPDTEATVCLVLAIALQYQSRIEEAKTVYKEVVALRQSLHDRPGEIAAWYSMALICHTMRRFPEAIDYLRQGETLSREIGDMGKLSNMLASLGAIEIHRGDYLKAHSLLEEALVLARKVGAPRTQGLALTNLGETELRLGRFAAARRHLECSSTILHWVEGGRYLVHTTLQMGHLGMATGRYHLAEESLQEAVDLALRIQDRTLLALALAGQAGVHRLQGDAATARIWCQRGRELAQEVADPQSLAACLTELGRIAHEERRCAEACELLLEARSLGREMGDQDLEHLASLALARVFLTEHRLAEAATLVEQLLERAEKAALAADLPEIMLLQGLLQLRSGDGSACVILLEQAIRQAEGACPADVGVELRQLYVVMKTGRPSMIRRVQRQLDAQLRGLALSVHGTARRRAFCRRMAKRQRHFWELAAAPPGPQMPPEQATALPVAGPETDDHSPVMENRPTQTPRQNEPPDVSSITFPLAAFCRDETETARLRSLLNLLVDRAVHGSRSKRGGLFLLPPERAGAHPSKQPAGALPQPVVLRNLERESLDGSSDLSGSILMAVLERGEALTAAQLLADPSGAAAFTRRLQTIPAILAVPVPGGAARRPPHLGVLYLDRNASGPPFETADLQAVLPLARQIGEILASLRQGEPCRPTEILQSVEQILDREVPAPAGPGATNSTGKIFGTTEIIGASPAMEAVFNLTHRLAGSRAPVLITGETGTGKELIARALHDASPWSDQPFVAVDCGALGESMAEAELFGHVKGAFSGAHQSRIGLLRTAHGGTLFLDELGNLGPSLQLKLLRVLESGEVRPVGSDRIHIVNIRLVAATNAHLAAEVTAGRFRRDLYHRLSGGLIHLPPLRERMEDLPLLVEQFLKEMTPEAAVSQSSDDPPRLSPAAWNLLHRHSWPGNVRELRLALEVALSMAGGPVVEACHLPATLSQDSLKSRPTSRLHRSVSPPALDCLKMPDTLEGKMVLKVLAETAWDKTRAARRIGWSRQKLYRAMKKYAIPTRLSAAKVEELQNHLQKDPEHSLNGLPP